jgi:hypothetical protein
MPFVTVFGYNFVSLNELLQTITLLIGITSGLFALFFQVRRWYRGRKLTKK